MNFWTSKIKIKNLEIPRLMSAPMDGVTDSPLRQMIREFSKDELLFTEMRHVATIANEKEGQSLKYEPIEHPLCFQFSANTLNFIEKAVAKVLSHPFDYATNGYAQGERRQPEMLNFNACCPAKNVIKAGGGSSLMASPTRLAEILRLFKTNIPSDLPFTIKIRAGYKEKNALEIADLAQNLGLDAIIIHPRTQPQMFSGPLDLELIKTLKKEISIPIIYSGNITCFADAAKVLEETGVDGFMIGRALIGSPWKIKEIICQGENREFFLDAQQITELALKHFYLNLKHYGQHGFSDFKKHLSGYVKGFKNACEIRHKLLLITDPIIFESELKKLALQEK